MIASKATAMKPLEIVVFYTDTAEIKFDECIPPTAKLTAHRLTEACNQTEYTFGKNSVVVIWDTTHNLLGMRCLEAIRRYQVKVPVLVVAENPTETYILAALRLGAHNLLRISATTTEIRQAINDLVQQPPQRWHAKQSKWLSGLANLATDAWQTLVQASQKIQRQDVLGIVPPQTLPFFNDKLEKGYTADISAQFFGNLRVHIKGKAAPEIKGKKNAEVLAYLLYHHEKSVHKDVLMEKFWGHVNTVSARNSLNVSMCHLRKHLSSVYPDGEVILYDNDSYCINPQLEVVTDIDKFMYLWKKGRTIENTQGLHQALHPYNKAMEVYKDDFLTNIRYEEWCEAERDKHKETYLFILHRLSTHFFEQKDFDQCVHICQRMLEKDPCLEAVHCKLMACFHHLGLHDLASKQYAKCEKILEKELSLSPSEATRSLHLSIKNGKLPSG